MLLTIHDMNLRQVASIDNDKQGTLNYYDDSWVRYLPTGSSTFDFTVAKKLLSSDSALTRIHNHLNEKSFVSFEYGGRTHLFTIHKVRENEHSIEVNCINLNLELINEYANPYKAKKAMSFVEYCQAMDLLNYALLSVGVNEISEKQLKLEWTNQETKLARLLNLTKQFGAELDFDTKLHADSSIKSFTVNVYHENDGEHQGVGRDRTDISLTYGKNIGSITREIDKTGIFNTIRPTGNMPTVEVEDSGERHLSSQRVKNSDGSTTETIIHTASDGTKSKTIVHTKITKLADKTRITTTTTTRSDGSIDQTVTTSKKGGPSNTEKRIIKPPKKKEKETDPEKEVLTLEGLDDWSIKNERGEVEFYQRGQALYAPLSMQLYPSTFTSATAKDQWTRRDFHFETDEPNELRRLAYLKLKQHCYPAITYEVDGFVDAEIGDTIQIYDDGFSPALIVKARVLEQKISFTNPASNKTTFANFKALENKLSSGIQSAFERLFEDAKPYTIKLATNNGIAFKNGQGQTIVTPTLMRGNKVINSGWRWTVDGVIKATSSSYIVRASDINQKMVLTMSAWIDNKEVASEQLTLINTSDGTAGKTQYLHRAWANSEDGRDGFSTSSSANKRYFGTYTDFTEADSQDPTRYNWTALFDNVKGGNRNYFKNGRTQQINTGNNETYDMRTFIFDDFWKNQDRLKPNYVRVAFEISLSPALAEDTQANVHFSASPWYKNQIVLKAGVTTPQSFEFTIDLSNASESYKTDNVFIRFGTAHGFPANQTVTLENAMLAVGTNFLGYVKAIEDVETDINSKADQGLTQEQLNALNEKAGIIQAELEAKASADTLDNWIKAYKDFVQSNETARAQAEKDLISASQRVSNIAKDLGELSDRWNFIDSYMSSSNEGLVIGKNDGSSSMMF
ncbi:phage tail protein, partial [Streptococcus oralis]|uniref:phage tail protein n=1 Tax=Streptococcus oralis TaxID=1303 RepID=UPI0030CA4C9D